MCYTDRIKRKRGLHVKKHIARLCLALLLPALLFSVFPSGVFAEGKTLATDKTSYAQGEEILITATGSGNDWVGVYRKGELPDPGVPGGAYSIRWYYVAKDGNASGSVKNLFNAEYINRPELAGLPAGDYTIYLCENDGYRVLSQVDITVTPRNGGSGPSDTERTLTTDKTAYTEEEPILATATGEGFDWVGLYLRTDIPGTQTAIRWYYVARDGNRSGDTKDMRKAENTADNRTALLDVPAGEYTIYLCENNGYNVLARINVTVTEDPTLQTVPEAPSSVAYERTGCFPGAADGKLTITAGEEDTLPGGYQAYWADGEGPLAGYTAFAPIPCTGKVTAYDVAANTLIPKEADRILVYAVRRNKRSEHAFEVMLPEGCNGYDLGTPIYELQVISDIHITSSQSHIHNTHFSSVLSDIQTLSPDSIGIFINGDITDSGTVAEYLCFEQLLKNAGDRLPPVYASIGNHDLYAGPYEEKLKIFLDHTRPGTDSVYYDLWSNGVHFLFLGSETVGTNATLSAEQLNWLREKLAEDRDENRPTYVFLHQGLIDTVAGTFAYQGWHGIEQATQLANILKAYPEVILFTGHGHWEMDSAHSMKARDERLPTIFNTAATAYLWNDACIATDVGFEGAQGYYLYAYEDKVLLRGRDFVTGQWIASAQFLVSYEGSDDRPEVDSSDAEPVSGEETSEEIPNVESASDTAAASDPSAPVGLLLGGLAGVLAIAAAAAAILAGRHRSGRHNPQK